MKKFPFHLNDDEPVIIAEAVAERYEIHLAVDTAASQTVLDWNVLLILGYSSVDLGESVEIETANGIMQVHQIKIKNLDALGLSRPDFKVLTYDFYEKGLLSRQDGVLGLDFFQNTVLTIDFQRGFIVLEFPSPHST